ncbi:Hypothetical protein PHPALM_8789 [Phytophthora palmivora]|uniref:Uncharacterized protein n=1 Tax=Phytophthora palmivora TaxID=4796 RepID=A0A2P4Y8Z8_9STRA|nr:Hypothetical protein PHPALM_8789 [Phytophthora palmivora]
MGLKLKRVWGNLVPSLIGTENPTSMWSGSSESGALWEAPAACDVARTRGSRKTSPRQSAQMLLRSGMRANSSFVRSPRILCFRLVYGLKIEGPVPALILDASLRLLSKPLYYGVELAIKWATSMRRSCWPKT